MMSPLAPDWWAALFAGLSALQLASWWVFWTWHRRVFVERAEQTDALMLMVSEHRDQERQRLLDLVDEMATLRKRAE